jgi:N5-(cytidine 5'-diphosphoramidyl)-L-glutamine hydrolase
MKPVAITQRVTVVPPYRERRDCLDQAWTRFMHRAGLLPVPLPNHRRTASALCKTARIEGVVLTGGDNLEAYGGSCPERDETEFALLDFAEQQAIPVLGVCRGMQVILHRFGVPLYPVEGHVTARHCVLIEGCTVEVNSYHRLAARETWPPLETWAVAADGMIEATRHANGRIVGIMWHPERMSPFATADIELFRRTFGIATECAP